LLETLGIPVLGYRTGELPLFYSAGGGPPVSARVQSPLEAASTATAHWDLGGGALLLARDPDHGIDVEPLVEDALRLATEQRITGQAVTPFVLSYLHESTGGRTLEVNRELIVANARLAAQVAVAATR
jgi:pseudouridylate synthase